MDLPSDASELPSSPSSQQPRPGTRTGLLPAFEPTSSPRLPRPSKRKYDGSLVYSHVESNHYPTPVPTSSTGILPSSPQQPRPPRPGLQRTASTVSERVPLGDVAGLDLPVDGEPLLLGRSSNSSQYQLSANRLISRVHVKAAYYPPDDRFERGRIIIECLGWNGLRIHCQGYSTDLGKGDTFTSEKPLAEIMVDVQDARVLIRWPAIARKESVAGAGETAWDIDGSPSRPTPPVTPLASSPPLPQVHLQSPISPSPRPRIQPSASATFIGLPANPPSSPPAVQVYEDDDSSDEAKVELKLESLPEAEQKIQDQLEPASQQTHVSSSLSSVEDFSDHDEENDPVVHSFGPFGENLLPRMASFRAVSPERRRNPLRASVSPKQPQRSERRTEPRIKGKTIRNIELSPIRNHVINQLAFSRLHSLPLSSILLNLPGSMKTGKDQQAEAFSNDELKLLLEDTACVGEIAREGKDAAGKPLENQYYYVPEMDTDEARRQAVEGSLGKPGLRAVRKQHKVRVVRILANADDFADAI